MMMKQRCMLLLAIFQLACCNLLWSQVWTARPSGSVGDIWSVRCTDNMNGVAAVWIQPGSAEILRTTNGGLNWATVLQDVNRGCTAVDFADKKDGCVVGGAFNYALVWRTDNSGSTWNALYTDNQLTAPKPSLWTIHFPTNKTGYTAGGSGVVMKTTDGGASWSILPTRIPSNAEVISIFFVNANMGFAIAGDEGDYLNGRKLYQTLDGGASWQLLTSILTMRALYFVNETTGYIAGASGGRPAVWKTTDGGVVWRKTYTGTATAWMNDIVFTPENPYVGYAVGGNLATGKSGVIIRTLDGGETWTEEATDLPKALRSVDFPVETHGIAVGDGGAVYTTERQPTPLPEPHAVLSVSNIDFGAIATGEESVLSVDVAPENVAGLVVLSAELDATAQAQGFSLDPSIMLPDSLAFGESMTISVAFSPLTVGPVAGALLITTNDNTPVATVQLTGEGIVVPKPSVVVSVDSLAFGKVDIGQEQELSFDVRGDNEAGLIVQSIAFADPDVAALSGFSLTTDRELPVALDNGETVGVRVQFSPVSVGIVQAAIAIVSNDELYPTAMVAAEAEGVEAVSVCEDRASGIAVRVVPHPLSAASALLLTTPVAGVAEIDIWSVEGRHIASVFSGQAAEGTTAYPLPQVFSMPGVYYCRAVVNGTVLILPLAR